MFAALAVLCAATYLTLNSGARYAAVDSSLGLETAPPPDLRHWPQSRAGVDIALENGVAIARLGPAEAGQTPALQAHVIPVPGIDALRVTLKAGARGIENGDESGNRARVQLLGFDAAGRFLWYWPKTIATLTGDRPYRTVSAVLPVGSEVKFARLVIYNGAKSGDLRVGPPRVEALAERPAFAVLRHALVLAWVVYGLWTGRALVRHAASPARAGLLLGAGMVVLVGALTPQPVFRSLSAPVEVAALALADTVFAPSPVPPPKAAPKAAPKEAGPGVAGSEEEETSEEGAPRAAPGAMPAPAAPKTKYPFSFKQISHFAVFVLLGLAAAAAFPRAPRAVLLAGLGAFAVSTEALQLFVVTRSGTLSDLVADALGLALAALAVAAAAWIMAAVRARRRARDGPGAPP